MNSNAVNKSLNLEIASQKLTCCFSLSYRLFACSHSIQASFHVGDVHLGYAMSETKPQAHIRRLDIEHRAEHPSALDRSVTSFDRE
jgi:hypothetical protein